MILICGDSGMASRRSSGCGKVSQIQQRLDWGFMADSNGKVDEFFKAAISPGAKDNIHRGRDRNTIRFWILRR